MSRTTYSATGKAALLATLVVLGVVSVASGKVGRENFEKCAPELIFPWTEEPEIDKVREAEKILEAELRKLDDKIERMLIQREELRRKRSRGLNGALFDAAEDCWRNFWKTGERIAKRWARTYKSILSGTRRKGLREIFEDAKDGWRNIRKGASRLARRWRRARYMRNPGIFWNDISTRFAGGLKSLAYTPHKGKEFRRWLENLRDTLIRGWRGILRAVPRKGKLLKWRELANKELKSVRANLRKAIPDRIAVERSIAAVRKRLMEYTRYGVKWAADKGSMIYISYAYPGGLRVWDMSKMTMKAAYSALPNSEELETFLEMTIRRLRPGRSYIAMRRLLAAAGQRITFGWRNLAGTLQSAYLTTTLKISAALAEVRSVIHAFAQLVHEKYQRLVSAIFTIFVWSTRFCQAAVLVLLISVLRRILLAAKKTYAISSGAWDFLCRAFRATYSWSKGDAESSRALTSSSSRTISCSNHEIHCNEYGGSADDAEALVYIPTDKRRLGKPRLKLRVMYEDPDDSREDDLASEVGSAEGCRRKDIDTLAANAASPRLLRAHRKMGYVRGRKGIYSRKICRRARRSSQERGTEETVDETIIINE